MNELFHVRNQISKLSHMPQIIRLMVITLQLFRNSDGIQEPGGGSQRQKETREFEQKAAKVTKVKRIPEKIVI